MYPTHVYLSFPIQKSKGNICTAKYVPFYQNSIPFFLFLRSKHIQLNEAIFREGNAYCALSWGLFIQPDHVSDHFNGIHEAKSKVRLPIVLLLNPKTERRILNEEAVLKMVEGMGLQAKVIDVQDIQRSPLKF